MINMVKLVLLVFFLPVACLAQRIENQQAEPLNNQIIITYDLVQGKAGDKYRVHLFSSHGNVKAKGGYLECLPRPFSKVTICDLRENQIVRL